MISRNVQKAAPPWFDFEHACSIPSRETHPGTGVEMLVMRHGTYVQEELVATSLFPRVTIWPTYYNVLAPDGKLIKRIRWDVECVSKVKVASYFATGGNVLLEVFKSTVNPNLNNQCMARGYGVPKAFRGQFFADIFAGNELVLAYVPSKLKEDLSAWSPNGPSVSIHATKLVTREVKRIVDKYPI